MSVPATNGAVNSVANITRLREAVMRQSHPPFVGGAAGAGAFTRNLPAFPWDSSWYQLSEQHIDVSVEPNINQEAVNFWSFELQVNAGGGWSTIAQWDTNTGGLTINPRDVPVDGGTPSIGQPLRIVGTPATGAAADLSAVTMWVAYRCVLDQAV